MQQYSNEKIEAVRNLMVEQAKAGLAGRYSEYDPEGMSFLRYYLEYMEGVNSGLYISLKLN